MTAHAEESVVIGNSLEWKSLLQYQKSFLGVEKSEVDGDRFFLSSEGKNDSVSELIATIEAFKKPIVKDEKGEDNEHAICRFPARFEYLKNHFNLSLVPKPVCASYRVYRDRIQNLKVSVVFSSYYSGSASSVFGHSFLKFSGSNENELFDTGINFAANPTTSNPALYAMYGMMGFFPSTFSAQPFYYKVREYNDFESRDLWSYYLNLNQDQKNILIAHLWELGNTYFDYFYLNENCSYQILRAIEGAVPSIRFFSQRPIYLIPSDSIKLLYNVPGLVEKVSYRPSIRNVAYFGYHQLDESQKSELISNLKYKNQISEDAKVLDVLIDSIDLNEAEKIVMKDPEVTAWKERVLQKRAGLSRVEVIPKMPVPEADMPSVGHGSRRISLGVDLDNLYLSARASHHDLLDPSIGYPRHLHIDFGRVGFRYNRNTQRLLLDELTLVDLTALSMEHPLYSRWSYDVKIAYQRSWFADCNDSVSCGRFVLKAGIGKTYPFLKDHTFFALLDIEPTYGSGYAGSKFKIGLKPSLNFLMEWELFFKSLFKYSSGYVFPTTHEWRHEASVETRYVFSNRFGLSLELGWAQQAQTNQENVKFGALYYF